VLDLNAACRQQPIVLEGEHVDDEQVARTPIVGLEHALEDLVEQLPNERTVQENERRIVG
jgi:hypothetical protein